MEHGVYFFVVNSHLRYVLLWVVSLRKNLYSFGARKVLTNTSPFFERLVFVIKSA